ncbi:tryptophan 7-halogenase [Planctomycetaceae bacterium]|jgi:flavin-dependent dehydrogenase|nr:tryptophan 7-halogenase [Planctomycetaceae bacterium]
MITTTPKEYGPQPTLQQEYDVIVMGAGPGGAVSAALIAEAGLSVLLLDRSEFPRFHVGESLIPETYWTLKRLGLLEKLKASNFPRKHSVQFVSDGHKESAPFYFEDYNPHECSVTWQVERGIFDQMLTDKAVENGTVFRTDASVMDVLFEGDRATGVKVKLSTEEQNPVRKIRSQVVVDSTGQSSFLVNRLGLKDTDPCLKKGTIWSYFKGALRDEGRDEGATIILQTEGKKSWFWYIPLSDDIVSVGCTGDMQYLFDKSRGKPEEVWAEELERCPALKRRLENAQQCESFYVTKDYSYKATQPAGPGWVLVGDASGFIDPCYSTGVFLALKSGEFAADAIIEGFQKDDLSGTQLSSWRETYNKGVENFRRLVYAFYTPGFSFGSFLKMHPQYKSHMVDILIGDVFKDGVDEIFREMNPVVRLALKSHNAMTDSTKTP